MPTEIVKDVLRTQGATLQKQAKTTKRWFRKNWGHGHWGVIGLIALAIILSTVVVASNEDVQKRLQTEITSTLSYKNIRAFIQPASEDLDIDLHADNSETQIRQNLP